MKKSSHPKHSPLYWEAGPRDEARPVTKAEDVAEKLERTQKALRDMGKPSSERERERAAALSHELNRLLLLRDELAARPAPPDVVQGSLF